MHSSDLQRGLDDWQGSKDALNFDPRVASVGAPNDHGGTQPGETRVQEIRLSLFLHGSSALGHLDGQWATGPGDYVQPNAEQHGRREVDVAKNKDLSGRRRCVPQSSRSRSPSPCPTPSGHSVASTLPRSFSQEAVGVACPSPPSQGCGRPGPSRLPNPPPDRLSVDDDVDSNVVSGASAVVSGRSRRPSHALDRPPSGAGVQQLSDKERIFLNMGSSSRSPSKPPTPQVVAGDVVDLTMDSDHEEACEDPMREQTQLQQDERLAARLEKQQLHSQHHSLQKDAEMAARLQDDFGGSNKAAVESEFKRFQEERASELLAKELEQTEEAEATQEEEEGSTNKRTKKNILTRCWNPRPKKRKQNTAAGRAQAPESSSEPQQDPDAQPEETQGPACVPAQDAPPAALHDASLSNEALHDASLSDDDPQVGGSTSSGKGKAAGAEDAGDAAVAAKLRSRLCQLDDYLPWRFVVDASRVYWRNFRRGVKTCHTPQQFAAQIQELEMQLKWVDMEQFFTLHSDMLEVGELEEVLDRLHNWLAGANLRDQWIQECRSADSWDQVEQLYLQLQDDVIPEFPSAEVWPEIWEQEDSAKVPAPTNHEPNSSQRCALLADLTAPARSTHTGNAGYAESDLSSDSSDEELARPPGPKRKTVPPRQQTSPWFEGMKDSLVFSPEKLDQHKPKLNKPLFLHEQVKPSDDISVHNMSRELLDEKSIEIQSGGRFSRARRLRMYTTNIRNIPSLPRNAHPEVASFKAVIGWPETLPLPPWAQTCYRNEVLGCIITKPKQSHKNIDDIRDWMKKNLVQKTPDGGLEENESGRYLWKPVGEFEKHIKNHKWVKEYKRKICLYNYVPDRKGLPRELSVIEREQVLGYPDGHMHAYGHGREGYMPAKFEMLGDSFDVRTVAHILAPLRTMQQDGRLPKQITVMSLFDGIGGAGAALHRAKIDVGHVILLEKDRARMDLSVGLWKTKFKLKPHQIEERCVDLLVLPPVSALQELVDKHGVDLVIGGSPCKQLSGLNRVHGQEGLGGVDSRLFHTYAYVVRSLREIYARNNL